VNSCETFRPGRSLPSGICERCGRDRHDHPWTKSFAPGAPVPSEQPVIPAVPKARAFGWPVTQELLTAYTARGFTEIVFRNPGTGEEATLLPPQIRNGVCGTCGQQLKSAQAIKEVMRTESDCDSVSAASGVSESVLTPESSVATQPQPEPPAALPPVAAKQESDPPLFIPPKGAVCPKCGSEEVLHHGFCAAHDPAAKEVIVTQTAENSESTPNITLGGAASVAPPTEMLHKCVNCGFTTNRAADLFAHQCVATAGEKQ
jgi:hypothetical protein